MGEIIGRITCPICGEEHQDLKVNIRDKLYMFCDNGCSIKLSSKDSRKVLASLRGNKSIKMSKIGVISPINEAKKSIWDDDDEF